MDQLNLGQINSGEHLLVITDVVTIRASGDETGGQLAVVEVTTPPGGGPPMLHRHRQAECFYILAGTIEVTLADAERRARRLRLGPGEVCAIPPMEWHTYRNVGAEPARFIAALSPAGLEQFFREIGVPLADPRQVPAPAGPPSDEQRQRMLAIIEKHMDVLPPDALMP